MGSKPNSDLHRLLMSEAMRPFWQEVNRIRNSYVSKLMSEEDPKYIQGVRALDSVLKVPSSVFAGKTIDL